MAYFFSLLNVFSYISSFTIAFNVNQIFPGPPIFHLLFISLSTGSLFQLEALDENGKIATIFIASGYVSFAAKEPRERQICGNERERRRGGERGGRWEGVWR